MFRQRSRIATATLSPLAASSKSSLNPTFEYLDKTLSVAPGQSLTIKGSDQPLASASAQPTAPQAHGRPLNTAGCLGGHIPAVFNGRPCACGAVGCAEAEASGWGLSLLVRDWAGATDSGFSRY